MALVSRSVKCGDVVLSSSLLPFDSYLPAHLSLKYRLRPKVLPAGSLACTPAGLELHDYIVGNAAGEEGCVNVLEMASSQKGF